MTLGHLKEVNGIAARSRNVLTLLVVPAHSRAAVGMSKLPIMYAPPIPITYRKIFHTVKPGETLPAIAKRYRVSVEDINRWNRITRLATGQKLMLEVRAPAKGKPRKKAAGRPYKKADR